MFRDEKIVITGVVGIVFWPITLAIVAMKALITLCNGIARVVLAIRGAHYRSMYRSELKREQLRQDQLRRVQALLKASREG